MRRLRVFTRIHGKLRARHCFYYCERGNQESRFTRARARVCVTKSQGIDCRLHDMISAPCRYVRARQGNYFPCSVLPDNSRNCVINTVSRTSASAATSPNATQILIIEVQSCDYRRQRFFLLSLTIFFCGKCVSACCFPVGLKAITLSQHACLHFSRGNCQKVSQWGAQYDCGPVAAYELELDPLYPPSARTGSFH